MKNVKITERVPFQYERLSVTDGAVVNLTAEYADAAAEAFLTVEDNNIRIRIDGGDPSATLGHLIAYSTNQSAHLGSGAAVRACSMIGSGGTAIVHVTYYR